MTQPKVEPLWAGEQTDNGWEVNDKPTAWLITGADGAHHALNLASAHLGIGPFWVAFDVVHVFDDTGNLRHRLLPPQPGWWRKVPTNGNPEGFHWRLTSCQPGVGAFHAYLVEAVTP